MKKNNKNLKLKIIISFMLVALLLVSFLFADKIDNFLGFKVQYYTNQTTASEVENSNYYVSYINVGQGSSTFVKLPDGKTMLIDGGDIAYGKTVGEFLEKHNVDSIDYMIATHSDSDHIGGLNYVLENFEVKNVYRPFQIAGTEVDDAFSVYAGDNLSNIYSYLMTTTGNKSKMCRITTKVFRDFVDNIYSEKYMLGSIEKECSVTVFYDELKIIGENYCIEFFGPLKRDGMIDISVYCDKTEGFATVGYGVSSSTANDNSAIFTLTCFDDKYLFMGDARFTESGEQATAYSEKDFINSLTSLEKINMAEVDVLLISHHGSKYSTSDELLEIVLPKYVIISCGNKNKYGHPNDETLERIEKINSLESDYLFRTDKNGTIEFSSKDGSYIYSLETTNNQQELQISYKLLSTIVVVLIITTMFSVKRKRDRR